MTPNDSFYEVCEECGRHVVKAGHSTDCSKTESATCENGHTYKKEHLDKHGENYHCPECGVVVGTDN